MAVASFVVAIVGAAILCIIRAFLAVRMSSYEEEYEELLSLIIAVLNFDAAGTGIWLFTTAPTDKMGRCILTLAYTLIYVICVNASWQREEEDEHIDVSGQV